MASREELGQIVNRLLSDSSYRARFAQNPDAAAQELNFTLSPGQREKAKQFQGNDTALKNMADQAKKDDMYVTWG